MYGTEHMVSSIYISTYIVYGICLVYGFMVHNIQRDGSCKPEFLESPLV